MCGQEEKGEKMQASPLLNSTKRQDYGTVKGRKPSMGKIPVGVVAVEG
jgi:hypothetical protein